MEAQERRLRLYEESKGMYSDESAGELMSGLLPVGWADVATHDDLALVRSEMGVLGASLRTEIADLRTEMHVGFADLRTEMHRNYNSLMRWTVSTMIALTAIFVALVRLGV
jgi:hypothetical protein